MFTGGLLPSCNMEIGLLKPIVFLSNSLPYEEIVQPPDVDSKAFKAGYLQRGGQLPHPCLHIAKKMVELWVVMN